MILRPSFLFLLILPLIAKVLAGAEAALEFIYNIQGGSIRLWAFLTSLALLLTAFAFALRYLIKQHWAKGAALLLAVSLAVFLPTINFHPEQFVFQEHKESYLLAIRADKSPRLKFKFFTLREFPIYPAGAQFYSVVYDETGEIGLRPD